jgi:hypothetical protein
MKAIKGLILFGFLGVLVSSCFNPPEYSNSPFITFANLQFKVTPDPSDADSLIIFIDFKDGDGDMGLDDNYRDNPYHERNFYFEDQSAGQIVTVGTLQANVNRPPYPQVIPMLANGGAGKLVTNRTRNKPGFGFLPAFSVADLECRNYTTQYLLVPPAAKTSIDGSYAIQDTLYDQGLNEYYLLVDTLYFERNLNHYNILVRFFQSTGGPFTEFSWEDEFCQTFNSRFPVLTDKTGSPLEGTIRYAMPSAGFNSLFNIKKLRLDVTVKDRALNQATTQSREFTLDEIRVNN